MKEEPSRIPGLARVAVALLSEGRPSLGASRAIARGLASLYLTGLAPGDRAGLLASELAGLRRAAAREAADHLVHARELTWVLAALQAGGIIPIVWKGRALAEAAWPAPAHRPVGDLDLLIEERSQAAAIEVLLQLGYRLAPLEQGGLLRPRSIGVELLPPSGRRLIVDLQWAPFRTVGVEIELPDLWARAGLAEVAGTPALLLDRADALLLTLVHSAKHGLRRSKWLLDLCALSAMSDIETWRLAVDRARGSGAARALWSGARLIDQVAFARPAPPEVLELLSPPAVTARLLAQLIDRRGALEERAPTRPERYALELLLEPSLSARALRGLGLIDRLLTARGGRCQPRPARRRAC